MTSLSNIDNREVVRVADLDFTYGDRHILHKINFTLAQGEFLGIVGPNGGGKTTLLRIMLGLLYPQSGSVSIFDRKSGDPSLKIGYVPQGGLVASTFPLKLLDVVLMGRLHSSKWGFRHSSADIDKAHLALEKVNLAQFASTPFHQLSGGLARRGLIARALCAGFPLLLLDEPTANVDAESRAKIAHLLNQLKGEISIIMVSHDMSLVSKSADLILYVEQEGRLMSPPEICGHFAMGLYHFPTPHPS